MLPSEVSSQAGSEESRHRSSAIACSCDAHGETFVLLWKPARAKRECNTKAGAGDAEKDAHGQHGVECVYEKEAVEKGDDDGRHFEDGGVFASDVLRDD